MQNKFKITFLDAGNNYIADEVYAGTIQQASEYADNKLDIHSADTFDIQQIEETNTGSVFNDQKLMDQIYRLASVAKAADALALAAKENNVSIDDLSLMVINLAKKKLLAAEKN